MEQLRKNLIYLTGFMGSGKSTIAPILANTIGYEHMDLDFEIEKTSGKKVSEIFYELGEKHFREIERTLLESVSQKQRIVVSLGGGTIANEANLKIIKSTGLLVYLKTDAEQIFHRMKHKSNRPLLRTPEGERLGDEELRTKIKNLLTQREPFYLQADVIIPTDESPIGKTIDTIVKRIRPLID